MLIKHTAYSREASGGTLGEQVYALGLSPPRYPVPSLVIRCEFEPADDDWASAWCIRQEHHLNYIYRHRWIWTRVIWEANAPPVYPVYYNDPLPGD